MKFFDKFKKKNTNSLKETQSYVYNEENANNAREYFSQFHKQIDKEIAELGHLNSIKFDYSLDSISAVMNILDNFKKKYKSKDIEENYVKHLIVIFGIYIGDTLLKNGLSDLGYKWLVPEEIKNQKLMEIMGGSSSNLPFISGKSVITPVDKTFKYWHNGNEDNLQSFCKSIISDVNRMFHSRKLNIDSKLIIEKAKAKNIHLEHNDISVLNDLFASIDFTDDMIYSFTIYFYEKIIKEVTTKYNINKDWFVYKYGKYPFLSYNYNNNEHFHFDFDISTRVLSSIEKKNAASIIESYNKAIDFFKGS